MTEFDKDIEEVKELINLSIKQGFYGYFYNSETVKPFRKYARTYFSTNENINGYLKFISNDNYNNALTVLASGDHLFNLINKGLKNIDTFDINRLAIYFVFGLKFAMIRKFSYEEYQKINNIIINRYTTLDMLTDILKSLLPFMDERLKEFWGIIIEYNYNLQKMNSKPINLIKMLTQNMEGFRICQRGNIYLQNKEEYLKLKNLLDKVNITYTNTDINNLPNNKYDLILFSNIISYYKAMYDQFLTLEKINEFLNMLNQNGTIFFNYFFENEIHKKKDEAKMLKDAQFSFWDIQPLSNLYDDDVIVLKRR